MNIAGIETALRDLVGSSFDPATFAFDFLAIYDAPASTIAKLRQGSANHAKTPGDLLWKNKLFFRAASNGQTAAAIASLMTDALVKQHKPRFIMATDGCEVQCLDVKADQTLDVDYGKLNDRFDFFLPLAGFERYEAVAENPADVKAAGRLAKLYDAITEANPGWAAGEHTHELNLFMARVLFCFFAEDTSIFEKGLFSRTVFSMTNQDGCDTAECLQTLFSAMDSAPSAREALPEFARKFPYVNGGLFTERQPIPSFSARARRLLRDCGELSWQEINPDIFGSMIQAIVEPDMRGDMGLHYTSVPNIMKVIQPLFLLSLEEEFEAGRDNEGKLRKLLTRIYSIRVFDPACGSGNFLIIAYRELRKLENRIFSRLKEIARQWSLPMTGVKLNHFYGIELADFATETAKLSLWIAEYQMNEQFKSIFGAAPPSLPLKDSGNIVHGNATRLDWREVCPAGDGLEIYVVGNPPYLGRADQTPGQKADMTAVFSHLGQKYKNLDYVACWYIKGAEYCKAVGAECALVTTNSICQGEQVALLWPSIFKRGLEIGFAHQSFKWTNNASHNAAVTCVIIGIRNRSNRRKLLYSENASKVVRNISPYLVEGDDTIVVKRRRPLFFHHEMDFGSMANDGGNLILSRNERAKIIAAYPNSEVFLRRLYGSQEFAKGIERWCLWIRDSDLESALEIPPIAARIEAVRAARSNSDREPTIALADCPHRFGEIRHQEADAIIVPAITSERREYITAGTVSRDAIITNLAFAVYDAEPWVLAVLSSRLHYVWGAAVGGRFKTDPRYSNTLVYNTFPIPDLSNEQKVALEDHAWNIIGVREAHPGKTIAWLYDPKTMPTNLLQAHRSLDDALDRIYIGRPFRSDTERLEYLFKLYTQKTKPSKAAVPAFDPFHVSEVA